MPGEIITHWTIRGALALYVIFLAGRLLTPRGDAWRSSERLIWTAACLLFLTHLAAAMHFYHDWNHWAAIEDTAEKTEALMGVRFGEGLYFSYAFAVLWLVDVAWWWIAPTGYRGRGRMLEWSIHAYMFFIAFNGAVVFESGVTRWVGIPATFLLLVLAARRWILDRRDSASLVRVPVESTIRS